MPCFVIDGSENIIKLKSSKVIIQKVYDSGDIKVRIKPISF